MKPNRPLLFLLATLALSGCGQVVAGSGHLKTESRPLTGDVDAVQLRGFGDLLITEGNTDALNVTADDNLLPLIESEVKGSVLTLAPKHGENLKPSRNLTYTLTLKSLRSLELSGAGSVAVSPMNVTDLHVDTSGSGRLDFTQLKARNLNVMSSGTLHIHLTGECENQTINSSGASTYEAKDLLSQSTSIVLSGASSIQVHVVKTLDVKLSGAGNVLYYGTPTVTKNISGVGNVSPAGH